MRAMAVALPVVVGWSDSMAERARRMRIGEPHPFPGQPVDVGRRDFRFRVVAAGITIAHVVRQQDEDVRLAGRLGRFRALQRGQRREQEEDVFKFVFHGAAIS